MDISPGRVACLLCSVRACAFFVVTHLADYLGFPCQHLCIDCAGGGGPTDLTLYHHGTLDLAFSVICGFYEMVLLRRLPEVHARNAHRIWQELDRSTVRLFATSSYSYLLSFVLGPTQEPLPADPSLAFLPQSEIAALANAYDNRNIRDHGVSTASPLLD
jgi:hypothetical protein